MSGASDAERENGVTHSAALKNARVEAAAQLWLAENRKAIEAYNSEIATNGVWSDGWRRW